MVFIWKTSAIQTFQSGINEQKTTLCMPYLGVFNWFEPIPVGSEVFGLWTREKKPKHRARSGGNKTSIL